jgi:signal transduction histidine kinase
MSLADSFLSPDADRLRASEWSTMRLVTAVQALSRARNLEGVIDIVRTAAREISQSDGATFILLDGDECHYVDEDAISPLWKGQRFPATSCVSGWAMINRRAALIKDIYADERIPFDAYRPTFVKSLVMVPIRQEDPMGAIGIYWAQHHAASDFEVELLQALANTAAVAMESVKLNQELERRVEERTRQLADANRELETFSYTVSHDLQAPLRHMNAYATMLEEAHGQAIGESGRKYVRRIQASATRLGGLITDLLRLARFGRVAMQRVPVDLTHMAREIADDLRSETPARVADFRIGTGMEAMGDPALLRVVLENLLGNAWKFTSKNEKTVIDFSVGKTEDGATVYSLRDNGSGFDMAYAAKLFAPFQRLHEHDEFPGSGIGLATVERIVRRHNGRVWAESTSGNGAVFFFTLGI